MQLNRRLAVALPLVLTLAACGGGNPQPPATPTATAPATPTVAAPAAPATPAQPAAAASEEALAPLMGSWAADLANCGGDLAITVSAEEFNGAENTCSIASWGDNGDGSYTATMNCNAQGQQTTERIQMTPVFAPTGEGINMSYLDRGGEDVTILRCTTQRG